MVQCRRCQPKFHTKRLSSFQALTFPRAPLCFRVQGPERPSRREECVAARRMLHRSARHLLHTLTLEALGLGACLSGNAAVAFGAAALPADSADADDTAESGSAAAGRLTRNAETVRREVGRALAALFVEPVEAVRRGQGWPQAARLAAAAVPGVICRPVGAAAAAVQSTCVGMKRAVQSSLPRE